MRVAIVSQEYPPETAKGGIGSQAFLKANGLAALGHEVHVISRATANSAGDLEAGGVHITRIPGFEERIALHTEPADWLTYSAEVAVAIAKIHQTRQLDLVEFPEWGAEGYVHLINRTPYNRIPTAIHLHGPIVMFAHTMGWPQLDSDHFRLCSMMEGTCLRLADAIYSSSQCSVDWCAKHHGIDPRQVPVLHTGVDTTLFHPRPVEPERRPTILFVGKIADNKGVRTLTQAAARLSSEIPNLQLRLIGTGPDRLIQDLRKTAARLGAPRLLDFPGFVRREDLPAQLCKGHVFAAPSLYEGGPGFVYLEAMACGLPVIACQGSGAAEAILDHGLLVPPEAPEPLANALRSLLTDETARLTLAARGRRHVEQHANSSVCVPRIASFFETAAAGKELKQTA